MIDFFTQNISSYVQSDPLLVHLVHIVLYLFYIASCKNGYFFFLNVRLCVECVPQLSKPDTDLQVKDRTYRTLLNINLCL